MMPLSHHHPFVAQAPDPIPSGKQKGYRLFLVGASIVPGLGGYLPVYIIDRG